MEEKLEPNEKAGQLAGLVMNMSYPEWSRARVAIEKVYDRHKAQVRLVDKEELVDAIEQEISW